MRGILSLSIVFILMLAGSLHAGPLGPSDCNTCFGSAYTLSLTNTTFGASTNTYTFALEIDTAGYTGGATDYIHSVAVKITNFDFTKVEPLSSYINLISAPGGTTIWSLQAGGDNSNGCNGKGAGFFCSQDGQTAQANGASYLWVWSVNLPKTESLFLGNMQASIKAEYDNPDGLNACITSEKITVQVPEPSLILLIGLGLGTVSIIARRWSI